MLGKGSDGQKGKKKKKAKQKGRQKPDKGNLMKGVQIRQQKYVLKKNYLPQNLQRVCLQLSTEEYMWARNQFFRSQFYYFTYHKHVGHFWKTFYKKLHVLQLGSFTILYYALILVQQKSS